MGVGKARVGTFVIRNGKAMRLIKTNLDVICGR
jgi:hypothetical protein